MPPSAVVGRLRPPVRTGVVVADSGFRFSRAVSCSFSPYTSSAIFLTPADTFSSIFLATASSISCRRRVRFSSGISWSSSSDFY